MSTITGASLVQAGHQILARVKSGQLPAGEAWAEERFPDHYRASVPILLDSFRQQDGSPQDEDPRPNEFLQHYNVNDIQHVERIHQEGNARQGALETVHLRFDHGAESVEIEQWAFDRGQTSFHWLRLESSGKAVVEACQVGADLMGRRARFSLGQP